MSEKILRGVDYYGEWFCRQGRNLEIDEQIQQEIKDGILPDPSQVDPITGEPVGGDLGDVPTEDDLESQGAVTDAQLSNDTKSAEI